MPETPRLLFVHAHPDDESLSNGATIAHYTARGAQVRVVTCTLGEEGEVIGERWAELAVDRGGSTRRLPNRRTHRGVARAGRQRSPSTSAVRVAGATPGWPAPQRRRRQRFIDADEHEAVGALVAIIREQRPHVVVTYDPDGGYGHPDHVHAPHASPRPPCLRPARDQTTYPGEPWTVPKFYWTVMAEAHSTAGWRALTARRSAARVDDPAAGGVRLRLHGRRHRRRGRGRPGRARRQDARRSPRTPPRWSSARPGGRAPCRTTWRCRYSAQEHYVLAAGSAGDRDERGWETDLLAGLGLNGSDTR